MTATSNALHRRCCTSPRRRTLDALRALVREWRRRVRTRRELSALCDRALRDIGITRYDALHETRKPFWRA